MQTSEQAAAPAADSRSIEQRIGDWLGGPSPEPKPKPAPKPAAAPEQSQEAQPEATDQVPDSPDATSDEVPAESTAPTFEEVEYEGKTYQVPPELKEAIIRQSDYTKKSQSLADQRRSFDLQQHQTRIAHMSEQFKVETAQEHQQLQALNWALNEPVDWSSMTTEQKLERSLQIQQWERSKAQLEQSLEGKRREWGEKQNAELAKLRTASMEAIGKRIPGFSKETAKAIREHAISEGYTETELNSILDPRHVTTLWKAQQFDLLKAKATPVTQNAKVVKTSAANPMPQETKDRLNFRKAIARTEGRPTERKAIVEQRVQDIFRKR